MPDAMQPVSKQVCSLVWLPPKSNLFFFLISIIFLFLIEFLFKNYRRGSALCSPKQGKDVLTTVGPRTHVNIRAVPSTPPLCSHRLMHVDALHLEFVRFYKNGITPDTSVCYLLCLLGTLRPSLTAKDVALTRSLE